MLGGSLGPGAQSAHALPTALLEPTVPCAAPGPVAHASAGLDFGGKELRTADAGRTADAIKAALTAGPLPAGARVVGDQVLLPDGRNSFTISVEPRRMPSTLPYAPVATAHFLGPDAAVVRVSDRATADLIRQAVAARLTEVAVIVADRSAKRRPDVTSGLHEGVLTTADTAGRIPLSPRDVGRVAALRILGDQLPTASTRVKTTALGSAIAMGLLDEEPARPVHRMEGNAPLVGAAAAAARIASVRALLPDSAAGLDKVLDLARKAGSQKTLQDIRTERDCERRVLREQADDLIAGRTTADAELTRSLNARFPQLPVIPHVIVGSGWAATVDFLTMPPVAGAGDGVPPVLAVAAGYGAVNDLGDFRLTQPAMDNELPGAPFQPVDFAEDRNDFVMSTAFGRAVGVARAFAGMPTYQANVSGIEARADTKAPAEWPADARYRLTTTDKRTLYAHSLDLATGLGPPRIQQAAGDQLAGRTFVDPDTGYQVAFGPVGDVRILDPKGEPYTGRLPANTGWLLGVQNVDGVPRKLSEPFLLDPRGRPTERRVIDPESRYSVDPDTRVTYAPDGAPVDPVGLDPALRARLGFRAEGYRDPRFVADPDSPYSVHPMTGAVTLTGSGEPVDRTTVPPRTLDRLDALVRAHRVQYGGQNTSASYRPDDDLLVVGGGAGGASEVEQAHPVTRRVTWGARPGRLGTDYPRGPEGALDPKGLRAEWDSATPARKAEIQRDLSFVSGGFNRRNTLPSIGAFSLPVWQPTLRTTDLPVTVRYTTTGRFGTTDLQGRLSTFSRIVYTIGQEADYPGGTAALLGSGTRLLAMLGPDGVEVNGLGDAQRTLRVLGAASVTSGVLRLTGADQAALSDTIKRQADVLPPDARTIHPSIRYHAGRIAEMNRTFERRPTR
ncbi:hypothetical protein R1T08_37745 [Streptomyces sp. SBC-4]|nr:hypothetical protein [Streptomyces sp. SBC-4]MDV5149703.1 hypothetical protein [Streptomyces sp. SBC-4]